MNKFNLLKDALLDEDKKLIGRIPEEDIDLDELQISGIYMGIDPYKAYKKLIDTTKFNYVVDNEGNEYIIPAQYSEYLDGYNFSNGYMSDLPPILYEVKFDLKNKNCILYFICTQDGYQRIFLNDDAIEILKNMAPLEIKETIKNAQKTSSRKRQ